MGIEASPSGVAAGSAAAVEVGLPLASEPLGPLTLGGYFAEVCQRHGNAEALVFHDETGVVRRSYAELWRESLALAQALIARGVTKETRVGLLATNRPEWVVALFGIALSGGQAVLLSTFARHAELHYQLRVADVSLLIFERSILDRDLAAEIAAFCPEFRNANGPLYTSALPFLRGAICIGETHDLGGAVETWADLAAGQPTVPAALVDAIGTEVSPADRALVFFSSGSTAKPKGVMHTHRAATIQCWRWPRIYGLQEPVRTWTANGFFWSGNFTQAIGATLSTGGCLVLQRFFDAGEALRLMAREQVTLPIAWPHQWARLAQHPAFATTDLSRLRYVGESSPLRRHPTVDTDWQEPSSAYGNTETLTYSAAHASGTDATIAIGNHGYPLPGNRFRIVDPASGASLPRGEVGEIAVKGPTLMVSYLRQTPDEVLDDAGFFHTGDCGFFDDQGRLHWQGRLNDIIKTGGANVSPLEVDAVIREMPGVKVVATVGVPHDTLGELVVACIVTDGKSQLDEQAVRAFVGERLSSYKVPRRVLFLTEADLVLTSNNKVKTAPLRDLASRLLGTV